MHSLDEELISVYVILLETWENEVGAIRVRKLEMLMI